MIGVVIVGHGKLAKAYLEAVEHVVGEQPGVCAVSINSDCDREAKQREISEAADSVDCGSGVVFAIDLIGSSPCNLSMAACNCSARTILCGANIPMLLKLLKSRHMPLDDAVAASMAAGRKYIDVCEASRA